MPWSAHLPLPGHWAYRWIYHWVCGAWPVWHQTYSYLPSHRVSPPFGQYQFILFDEKRYNMPVKRSGQDSNWLQVWHPNHYATTPHWVGGWLIMPLFCTRVLRAYRSPEFETLFRCAVCYVFCFMLTTGTECQFSTNTLFQLTVSSNSSTNSCISTSTLVYSSKSQNFYPVPI